MCEKLLVAKCCISEVAFVLALNIPIHFLGYISLIDTCIQAGVKDVITLFHAPSNQASIRVHTILKQAAAAAQSHATEDQASSHDKQSKLERTNFELGT